MTDTTRSTRSWRSAWVWIPGGMLLAATLLLILLVAVTGWLTGLRVERAGWQQGVVLQGWQVWQDDCLILSGDQATLHWQWPLSLHVDRLRLGSCPRRAPVMPAAPGWAPPFTLAVDALEGIPGIPKAPALTLSHRQGAWRLSARLTGQQLQADYQRASARWRLDATLLPGTWQPGMQGRLSVAGQGRWQERHHDGVLRVLGDDLGLSARPERARARGELSWRQLAWRLSLSLPDPLALPGNWLLAPGQALTARGDGSRVQDMQAALQLTGPLGRLRLLTRGQPGGRHGTGELILDQGSWSGRWPLRWDARELTVLPVRLQLAEGLRWQLLQPVALAWARDRPSPLAWQLDWRDLRLASLQGALLWQEGLPTWQGRLALSGQEQGMQVSSQWQGQVSAAGAAGPDLQIRLRTRDRDLNVRVPVTGIRAPDWPLQAQVSGRWQGWPIQAQLTARQLHGHWQGRLTAASRLLPATSGGEVTVSGEWRQEPDAGMVLLPGSRIDLRRALFGTLLVQPASAQAISVTRWNNTQLTGRWQLAGAGAALPRQRLPAWRGELVMLGQGADLTLHIPDWQSRATLTAAWRRTTLKGTLALDSPVHPDMGGALGLVLRRGTLSGNGHWQLARGAQVSGQLQLRDLHLDSGSTAVRGLDATLTGRYDAGVWELASEGPVHLATVAIGTDITDLRFLLQGGAPGWQVSDLSARLLGGTLTAPRLTWPASDWQTVTLTGMDLAQLVALEGKESPPVKLGGRVGGTLPLRLGQRSLAIRDGVLRNEGGLTLQVPRSPAVQAMSQSNRALQLAMDTLSDMRVSEFDARIDMAEDGWLDARVKIRGDSVQPLQPPVVLNYSHRENVLQLLRSLRIGDEISQQVIDRHGGGVTQ